MARYSNAKSLFPKFPNIIEHVLTKSQINDASSPSQSVKPRNGLESLRHTFVWCATIKYLVAFLIVSVIRTLLITADKSKKL
jgi:hypothetical protein